MDVSPIDKVLLNLRNKGDVKSRGKGWRCCCPAHDDGNPSLDVDIGEDGRVLLCCRSANCPAEKIVSAIGLSLRDLMPTGLETNGNGYHRSSIRNGKASLPRRKFLNASAAVKELERQHGKRSAMWTYLDEAGTPVGLVVRWDLADGKKEIRPVARHTDGEWYIEAMKTPRPLYRLPDLVGASRIIVTEGEKCADAARSLGFIATTSAGGSQAADKTDWRPLAGKDVLILRDNDMPGLKYSITVAAILQNLAPPTTAKILTLPGLPESGDLVDWIADHGDAAEPEAMREEIEALAQEVKPGISFDSENFDAKAKPEKKTRFEFIGSTAFASGDYRPEWHIKNVLVRKQPGVIAGPSKALKTSLAIDMGVSLASGSDFLGKFTTLKKTRVAVVSGESGEHTLQESAKRVCRAKHLLLEDLGDYLCWCFTLPTFSDLAVMHEFATELTKLSAEVVIIDPVYLALGDIDAKNLFEAGAAFRIVAEVLLKAGCTPILIHHANRQLVVGEPMELTHLAYSGLEQFSRQFVLLNRRSKYMGDGTHDLWCSVGGSAGHGGLWNLQIREGLVDSNFAGREWNVEVLSRSEVHDDESEGREAAKREADSRRNKRDEAAILDAIDAETKKCDGATQSSIKDATRITTNRLKELLESLIEHGTIEEINFEKAIGSGALRSCTGYRRRPMDF